MAWKTIAALVPCAVASALAPAAARGDESNYRPYVIGSRAAGMGGAFTALADDGSGPYYNPGGVAFVKASQLSLAGSVYGLVTGRLENALGDEHDFRYSNLNTLPTTTAAIWKLGGAEPSDTADVLAVAVYVPDALTVDGRDTLGSKENAFFFASQSQTIWAGLTYARRMGRIGIGASGFLLLGTQASQLDLSAVAAGSTSAFGTLSSRFDESTWGFVGAAGIRWDVTDEISLGLSVHSPALGAGKRRAFLRLAVGDGVVNPTAPSQIAVVNADDLHASPSLPLRAQAGLAWVSGRLTLAADVTLLAAREVHDDADRAAEGLDKRVVRNAVVNGSLGVEYVAADHFPLRAGVYTDFAASRSPVGFTTGQDPNADNTSHVNRYGLTASVGYRTEHSATDIGFNLSAASGTDLVPDNLDFSRLKTAGSSQLLVYVFLGAAYQF